MRVSTRSYLSWDINLDIFSVAKKTDFKLPFNSESNPCFLRVSPELPFVYLPDKLFTFFMDRMNTIFEYEKPCNKANGVCKFEHGCSAVKKDDFSLVFTLNEKRWNRFDLSINPTDMLFPGE